MPYSTSSSLSSEPNDLAFGYFLAKPFVAWNPLLSSVHAWMQTCGVAHASMQREWFAFIERRLQADAVQMQKLNHAKSDEAWRLCYEFCEKAWEDYRTEYGQLAALGTDLINETMSGTLKAMTPLATASTALKSSPPPRRSDTSRPAETLVG